MILDGKHTLEIVVFLMMYHKDGWCYNICNKIKHEGGLSALPLNL